MKPIVLLRILYPLWVLSGIFSIMYIPSLLIDRGDLDQTIANINAQEGLFRLGIVGRIITQLFYIIIPLLLFELFAGINKRQAVLMLVFSLISIPMALYNETNHLAILSALDQPEIVLEYLNTYRDNSLIVHLFWGLWLFPLGVLVYQSNYFPRIIALALFFGGTGYFLGSIAAILFPEASVLLSILDNFTIGELVFIIWLVFLGIKSKE